MLRLSACVMLGAMGFVRRSDVVARVVGGATDNADLDHTVVALTAAAARLVPADALGPGAREARVDRFLASALVDARLFEVAPLLCAGAAFLDELARAERNTAFAHAGDAYQDDVITRLAADALDVAGHPGSVFVRVLLVLTLEGFLGDPKHGGNDKELGWRVVGYAPRTSVRDPR